MPNNMSTKYAPSVSRKTVRHALALMDMEYKPSEIATECRIAEKTVYRWLDIGAPTRRDAKGHYWIHGTSLREWVESRLTKKATAPRLAMALDEAFCTRCKKAQVFTTSKHVEMSGSRVMVFGTCNECGGKVNRILSVKVNSK